MKKRLVFSLLVICCCSVFLIGCSKDDEAAKTATVKTPLQLVNESLIQYKITTDSTILSHWNSITDLVARMGAVEVWKSGFTAIDLAPLTARVAILEASNLSDIEGDLSFVNVRVATLESYNISARLAVIEARLNASPTTTPLPNGSTPTPTPTGNHNPNIISLIASPLTPTSNQSWIVTCAANDSDGDTLHYIWASTGGTLLYFAGNNSLLWSLSGVGNYSIVCQVNDGKDGYALGIKSVTY